MENQGSVENKNIQNQVSDSTLPPKHAIVNFLVLRGIILVIFILFGFGAYNLGKQASVTTLETATEPSVQPTQDIVVSPTSTPISNAPTAVAKQVRKSSYALPTGWQTKTDTTERLEVGYDASRYDMSSQENRIDLAGKWVTENGQMKRLGWNKQFFITSYSGGSRHAELYKILGVTAQDDTWKAPKYFGEREYSYNGWNCLFINGVSISQYPVAWGYCPISATEALVLAFDGYEWSDIEQQTAAIRLVK